MLYGVCGHVGAARRLVSRPGGFLRRGTQWFYGRVAGAACGREGLFRCRRSIGPGTTGSWAAREVTLAVVDVYFEEIFAFVTCPTKRTCFGTSREFFSL